MLPFIPKTYLRNKVHWSKWIMLLKRVCISTVASARAVISRIEGGIYLLLWNSQCYLFIFCFFVKLLSDC